MSDPIFPPPPPVPVHEGHPQHEKHHTGEDWVVIHRGKEGSKAHVQSLEHKLIKAKINARVSHDDEHRVILEVHAADEHEAKKVIGSDQVSGLGEKAHETSEQRMEDEEKAALSGPFKMATTGWVLIVLAVAVLFLLSLWMLPLLNLF